MELSGRIFIKEIGSEFSLRSPFEALETFLRFRVETFGQKKEDFFFKDLSLFVSGASPVREMPLPAKIELEPSRN